MGTTKITWADAVWNPVTGCTKISEGCQNCYAERMAKRLAGRYGYPADEPFRVTFHPERLDEPRKWKKPRRVFVCSMGDLFHEDIDFNWIQSILHHIWLNRQHAYLFLTKRPLRMLEYGEWNRKQNGWTFDRLKNLWLGVSVENQKRADERMPILLQIPARIRFVSCEPMLGPISLLRWLPIESCAPTKLGVGINWVILGGETGPKARPMHPDWVRKIKDDCQEAGVPFFFKQWGEYMPKEWWGLNELKSTWFMDKGGKKATDRMLDGKMWEEMPDG